MAYYHFHIFMRGKKKGSAKPMLYSGIVNADPNSLEEVKFYKDLISSAFSGKVDASFVEILSKIVDHDGRYDFVRKFSFCINEKFKYKRTGAFLLTEVDFKGRTFYTYNAHSLAVESTYKYSSLYSHVNFLEDEE